MQPFVFQEYQLVNLNNKYENPNNIYTFIKYFLPWM